MKNEQNGQGQLPEAVFFDFSEGAGLYHPFLCFDCYGILWGSAYLNLLGQTKMIRRGLFLGKIIAKQPNEKESYYFVARIIDCFFIQLANFMDGIVPGSKKGVHS
ncbi:hypothetical protein [Paenibacillus sp.]|uniref:hypothetical protein n=1 Tax=Paenibacillus sp. TaxID=58172 RepID=UPI002837D64C|nr:hypothetical protein [Paenibacillus sp.]MDR0268652.1 hypothetical protein [Paenibacillus sp.]